MPKNRDYTGLVRTPSSMAWLISRRSAVKGQIDRLEKSLERLPMEIAALREEMRAIDTVIPLHEVAVDPTAIIGRQPRQKNLLALGAMRRSILNLLRSAKKPLYTSEIAMHVGRENDIDFDVCSRVQFTKKISYRLKSLAAEGIVARHHPRVTKEMGLWSLCKAAIDDSDGKPGSTEG